MGMPSATPKSETIMQIARILTSKLTPTSPISAVVHVQEGASQIINVINQFPPVLSAIPTVATIALWRSKSTPSVKSKNHVSMAIANVSDVGVTLRMALQAPVNKFRQSLPVGVIFNVIWDSGASISISNDKRDFVGGIKKPGLITQLKGIAKGLRTEGQGHVIWVMHNANGYLRKVRVPKCRVKLLSTTSLLQEHKNETIKIEAHQMTLSGIVNDPTKGAITACSCQSNKQLTNFDLLSFQRHSTWS
jgi:hypothetical protein